MVLQRRLASAWSVGLSSPNSAGKAVDPGVAEARQVTPAREAALEEHRNDRAERTSNAPPGSSFGDWVS